MVELRDPILSRVNVQTHLMLSTLNRSESRTSGVTRHTLGSGKVTTAAFTSCLLSPESSSVRPSTTNFEVRTIHQEGTTT
eukprot:5701679-Amphidinium_carterae.1